MARIKIQDVREQLGVNTTYDLAKAILDDSSFKDYGYLASADDLVSFGDAMQMNKTLQNEFINALIERIGLVIVRSTLLENPLKFMKKGTLGLGRSIEEIFTDITVAQKYDPEDAEQSVFRRAIPNVKVLFHEMNRQDIYTVTVQEDSLKTAFTTWDKVDSFITSILNTLYNSAEFDEYKYMMMLIENYFAKSHFKVVQSPVIDSPTAGKEFTKLVREHGTLMTMPQGTRDYNALAVHTRSDADELYLIITAKAKASLDVDVLASAFNLNPAQTIGKTVVVDKFASPNLQAVLVDESFFMVYDKNQQMTNQYNGKGLYTNYFYHIWQVQSTSRFANAIAFVSGAVNPVTDVIIDPAIHALKPGREQLFKVYVRQTDTNSYTPVWTVTGLNGTVVDAGTTISDKGLLKVSATQMGELLVKATVSYGTGEDVTNVVGESIVSIIQ